MYSEESSDAPPSPGIPGVVTNGAVLYSGYKQLMKSYVGLKGASSPRDALFACPADTFFPSFVFPDTNMPAQWVREKLHDQSVMDYSTYAFNGGDNVPRNYGGMIARNPGLTGIKLGAIRHPSRTVLVAETAALGP